MSAVFDVTMTKKGPIFDGRAVLAAELFCRAAEAEVAKRGVNVVRTQLHHVLKNPTGYYESHIQTERAASSSLINDANVVYGPWLAGTGSRNSSSRFKGYQHWRRATQQLQLQAGSIAQTILGSFLRRMQ